MPAEKFKTKLIVRECKHTYSGTTRSGSAYKLYQVIATKPDGTPISQNLRSFSDLPRNEVLEVECELHQSEQYGPSYTVSVIGGADRYARLEDRVQALEDTVMKLIRGGPDPAPPPEPPPAPPPAPPPVQPAEPPPPPAVSTPQGPSEGDIPF